jgi:hypothetical protein
VISSEVIMAAENALKEALGVRVVLTVDEQPPPEWDGMKAGGNRS